MSTGRRGRRPGAPDTRAAIMDAARLRFAAHGIAGTSLRAIAADAGVDPALVHHYFASKEDLFVASLNLPIDPRAVFRVALAGPRDEVAATLLEGFLAVWDNDELRVPALGLVRGALDPQGGTLLADGFFPIIAGALAEAGIDHPERRAGLLVSQMLGLIITRYVVGLAPIASMSRHEVIAHLAPTLTRYLTEPLP